MASLEVANGEMGTAAAGEVIEEQAAAEEVPEEAEVDAEVEAEWDGTKQEAAAQEKEEGQIEEKVVEMPVASSEHIEMQAQMESKREELQ